MSAAPLPPEAIRADLVYRRVRSGAWSREDIERELRRYAEEAARAPTLARHQPCGCVVCRCEDAKRCTGCGAKHCGTHPVGAIPSPVYATANEPCEHGAWEDDTGYPIPCPLCEVERLRGWLRAIEVDLMPDTRGHVRRGADTRVLSFIWDARGGHHAARTNAAANRGGDAASRPDRPAPNLMKPESEPSAAEEAARGAGAPNAPRRCTADGCGWSVLPSEAACPDGHVQRPAGCVCPVERVRREVRACPVHGERTP